MRRETETEEKKYEYCGQEHTAKSYISFQPMMSPLGVLCQVQGELSSLH